MSAKITMKARLRAMLLKARAKRKARLSTSYSGTGGRLYPSRAARHEGLDVVKLRKRRAKNRVARHQRRANRLASKR